MVWLWSRSFAARGGAFVDILIKEELEPGEVKTAGRNWRQRDCRADALTLPRGRYVGRGLWIAMDNEYGPEKGWWSNPVEFRIRG